MHHTYRIWGVYSRWYTGDNLMRNDFDDDDDDDNNNNNMFLNTYVKMMLARIYYNII
jgi:hypothetical protein